MLGQFPLTRSETAIDVCHWRVNTKIASRVAKRFKTYNHGLNI